MTSARDVAAGTRAGRVYATRRGAWRVGGLFGALLFSVVCWTLIYHGVASVVAWSKPEPRLATATMIAHESVPSADPAVAQEPAAAR